MSIKGKEETPEKPLLSHWKLDCSVCGSNGDDVYRYSYLDLPNGGHITLFGDGRTMLCEACKQAMIEKEEAAKKEILGLSK